MLGRTPRSSVAAPRFGGNDLRPSVRTYVRGEGHQRTNLGEGHGRTAVLETSDGGAQDEYLDKPRFSYRGLGVHDLRTYLHKYPCLTVCKGYPRAARPASSLGRQRPRQGQRHWPGENSLVEGEAVARGIELQPCGSPRSLRLWLLPRIRLWPRRMRLRPPRMRLRPRRRWIRTRSRTSRGEHMYATLRTYVAYVRTYVFVLRTYVLSFPV